MRALLPRWIVGKSLFLLVFLLVFVMISSALDVGHGFTQLFYIVLFISILSAIYTVGHNKLVLILDSIIAAGIIIANFLTIFYQEPELYALIYVLAFFFSFVTAFGILTEVLQENDITLDRIYAAASVYLLLGLAWGFLYLVIEVLFPGSFHLDQVSNNVQSMAYEIPQLLYFSFVTLTTLGYGDIVPINLTAKSLACIEAIMGQLYLLVLISRLIGIYVAKMTQKNQ